MAAILTNGVLKIRTAPIFQPLLAPARYKGSGTAPAVASTGSSSTQRQTAKLTLSQLINRLLP